MPNIMLALPIVFSQAGQMLVGLVDTFMVGQLGATELAAVSFANSILVLGFVLIMGLSIGVTPLVGKANGAGKQQESGFWLRQGLTVNLYFAILLILMMFGTALLMPFMGQEEAVVALAIPYYLIIVVSMLPFCLFMVFKQFAEGIANTRIAMVITLIANVINIVLNYLLIFGKAGMPQLGINGAGYATLISRIFMAIVIVVTFASLSYFREYKKTLLASKFQFKRAVEILKIGFPIGGQMLIEVFAFSMGAIMMGWISKDAMAAHQIVISLASLTYMMSLGLSSAATIKVSNFLGAGDMDSIKYSAYAIIHKVIVFMSVNGVLFILLRNVLPALFVHNESVVHIAAQLMIIAGVFQLFDGLQVVWLGILRGLQDVKAPSVIAFITWIIIALPISYVCAFTLNMGSTGVWLGYLSGLFVGSVLLQIRYVRLYKRLVKG
jgi:MATE family multidrug resistance protein